MKKFLKNKKGEAVIESTIIVTFVMLFLLMIIYMGFMIYHQTMVSVVANQAAANIAQVYSNSLKDPFTGYIDASSIDNPGMIAKMKDETYRDLIEEKAQWYSHYRLRKYHILNTGKPNVDVEIVSKEGELMKAQVVVTIEDELILPLAKFFGSEGRMKMKSVGRADCFDVLDYKNIVDILASGEVDTIDLTENFTVTFYQDKTSGKVYTTREVMQNTSIAVTSNHNPNKYKKFPSIPVDDRGAHFFRWEMPNGEPFDANSTVYSDLNVYAVWRYQVSFNPNGGTVSPSSIWVLKDGTPVAVPIPTKQGATFDGWYMSNGQKFDNNTIVTGDMTVTARWKYTVTFYNGNSKVAEKYVFEKETIKTQFPTAPSVSKTGREFYRWEDANGRPLDLYAEVTKNLTYYAKWKYTVTADAAGGTIGGLGKKVYHFNPGKTIILSNDIGNPEKSGANFEGWYRNGSKVTSFKITGDITITAKWSCIHNYVLQRDVPATCITKGAKHYKCSRCLSEKQDVGNFGNHNYQYVGTRGNWCYERVYEYKCSHCGHTYTTPGDGGTHRYTAQCTSGHSVKKGTFKCSRYNYVAGSNKCQTTKMYHITCEFCGSIQVVATYKNGRLVTNYTYRCGTHGQVNKKTQCGYGGSKK